ncbi:MAG: OmpA family protein [Bacteroidaceae bacterium]|nr:OmpA family protein [Bacteroidaceae bacterium]
MMQFKNVLAAAALALGVSVPAVAQTTEDDGLDYKPYPHMFVGVQGGAQTTFTNYDNLKLITPTASVSFGAFFTPVVGARLHFNGWQNKGGFKNAAYDLKYDYKYAISNLDLMLNLSTLFGKKNYYPVNVYLIGGVGVNYVWDNGDAYGLKEDLNLLPRAFKNDRLSRNARVGAMVDVNLLKNLSLNAEISANNVDDRNNSKVSTDESRDWQLNAQVGLAVKFGYKKKEVKEEWATRVDTIWYDDVAYTPRVEDGTITWNVFYEIRESDFNDPDAQLANIGAFLKDHRECKVTIKSYADVQTGNPKINMGYSQQRSEKAVKALVDAGVDPSIIKAEYFGDTVQPFAENDKNRVSIITATGLKDVKDKYTVKKYRTKEVRYRVK